MDYASELLKAREQFPFDDWRMNEEAMEQYSEENCEAAKRTLDTLLTDLVALGQDADEESKIDKFRIAVEALNTLNEQTEHSLIETGEREELCELFNVIAVKAGIDPKKYGDGEGPASEFRDW